MPVVKNRVLFLTLRVFSATGGIERVCRIAGKAMYELGLQYGGRIRIHAIYSKQDKVTNNPYFPSLLAKTFRGRKINYVLNSIRHGLHSRKVVLSHVNLLLVGYLIKRLKPSVKLVLIAHGIEVWKRFPGWKRKMLNQVDLFLPVSHYTSTTMQQLNDLPAEKFRVLNNCLDPFLEQPLQKGKPPSLQNRYGLPAGATVVLTVARMAATEHYKGYDRVITVLPTLLKQYPCLYYLLVGKYDDTEKQRLDELIAANGLQGRVIFTGMVPDEELPAHFCLSDIFVMPSEKEGFGIVFIEAMFYGKPVIAGNADGSVDALCNGELGLLVNPSSPDELIDAFRQILPEPEKYKPNKELLNNRFSYTIYKKQLGQLLGLDQRIEQVLHEKN